MTFAQLPPPLAPGTESGTYSWTCAIRVDCHATVQCSVLALRRQHPLCAVMVEMWDQLLEGRLKVQGVGVGAAVVVVV